MNECRVCSKNFKDKRDLDVHKLIHAGEKPYKCQYCTKVFAQRHDLTFHECIHSEEEPFKCELCSKSFTEKGTLNVHKRIHAGEKPYKCELVSKSYAQKSDLTTHKDTQTGERPYKCELCSKVFNRKGNFDLHRRIHAGEKPYKCELCSRAFSKKGKLVVHKRRHTGEKPYKCELCSKIFNQKGNFDVHKRRHIGEKLYKCELCSKVFNGKGNFDLHRQIHAGEKPYKCELCSKAFTKKGKLVVHKRRHTCEKTYKCELCSKIFNQKANFDVHIRIHAGKKPYKCEYCPKAYTHKTALAAHKRKHTGEQPFKCELFSKSFAQKHDLTTHKETQIEEKPYKCELCSKIFNQKGNFDVHRRIHTDENPYKCELCSIVFTHKMTQIRHKRIHAGKKAHILSFSTSAIKETLKKQPFSEDASISIQEVPTQEGKDEHEKTTKHCIRIQSICSQLFDYRMKHMISPEEVFKDIKLWQVEDGAMANRSMHPLKTEDYSQFLSICNNDIRESNPQISSNLLVSPLLVTIQCFLSYVCNNNSSTTSIDSYPENQTHETVYHLKSEVQENSCDVAANATGGIDYENKGEELVIEASNTDDDPLSTAGHLLITNFRSLEDCSSGSQSSCVTEEEKGNLNLKTPGYSIIKNGELGTHSEEESQLIKEKKNEFHESSAESLLGENAETFFKSEVILSDEEDSHDWKLQNMSEVLALNNVENHKGERETSTTCISTSNGEESARNDLVIRIVGNSHLDSKDLLHIQMLSIKTRETETRKVSFDSSSVSNGEIQIVCKNRETVEWCKEMIPQLPARDPTDSYRVYGPGEEPLTFVVHVPDIESAFDPHIFLFTLRLDNDDLPDDEIKVLGTGDSDGQEEVDGMLIQLLFHKNHLTYLQENDFSLNYGFGRIQLRGPEEDYYKRIKTKESS